MSDRGKESSNNDVSSSLRVAEAEQSDVGRKIARVDPEVARQLELSAGDALKFHLSTRKQLFCLGLRGKKIGGKV